MAIRTILEAQGDEHETTVMLHLLTQNGPVLLEMIANLVATESEPMVIVIGRTVESDLATLIVACESVVSTDSAVQQDHGVESEWPSSPSSLTRGLFDSVAHRVDEGFGEEKNAARHENYNVPRDDDDHHHLHVNVNRAFNGPASQYHWDSDRSSDRERDRRRIRSGGVSDTSSMDSNLQSLRLHRRACKAIARRQSAMRGVRFRLRAVGAFIRHGWNRACKRTVAMWLKRNPNMNLAIVNCIGALCWEGGC